MRRSVEEERASLHTAMSRMYEDYDELSELLDDLLRAHAHELAEQIRTHARRMSDPHGPYRTAVKMADEFASLITLKEVA